MIIALEGGEACGKGTVAQWLAEEHGFVPLHDPGSTPLALQLREVLLHRKELAVDERQMALLFTAATADVLKRAQQQAATAPVVLDRTYLSICAHRLAGGMPLAHVKILMQLFLPETAIIDKALYLHAPWSTRKARMVARGGGVDRFESKDDEYHMRVERAYDGLATAGMCQRVDASGDVSATKAAVAAVLGLKVA